MKQEEGKKIDRRKRRTREQLRNGLAELMEHKNIREITVKELVEKVDINRSTFYLHYSDIYDMLEKIENELAEEIQRSVQSHPVSPFNEASFPFIEDVFSILEANKKICRVLLGPNGDMAFLHQIQSILEEHSLRVLAEKFPDQMEDLKYAYAFCMSGCTGLIKTWLKGNYGGSPQHMAELTFRMIINTIKGFHS